MLAQFTWTDFFMTALPLLAVWYAWLFLVYSRGNRRDSFSVLAGAGSGDDAGSLSYAQVGSGSVGPGLAQGDDLMGKSKMPDGMSRVVSSDLMFAEDEGVAEQDQPGLVLDVIAEMKELFGILAREDGTKQDFFRLIAAVKEAYPGIGTHPGIAVINAYVVEHAPFLISLQELDSLWD
jgi:hypothetical protein